MKRTLSPTFVLASVIGTASLSAQTTWNGADAASLTSAGNWSNGVPSLSNTGTIPNGTLGINFNSNVTNWIVVQEGGNVSTTSFRQFNGGSWTMNGGSMSLGNNFQLVTSDNQSHVFTVNPGASASTTATLFVSSTGTNRSATLNISGGSVSTNQLQVNAGGTVNFSSGSLASSGTTTINAGGELEMSNGTRTGSSVTNSGSLVISGGNFSTNLDRSLTTNAGGTTTISGGSVSIGQSIGDSLIGTGAFVFEGGTTTLAGDIRANAATFSLTMGGTTVGTLTGDAWHSSTTYRHMNWLSGTLMSVTLSGDATWAETEWTANRMLFNGDSASDLGLTWADVTNPLVGFNAGGGSYFDWDSTSRTLALVTVPEPSSFAFLAAGMTALVAFRRRPNL